MNNNQKIVELIEKRLTQGAKEHGAEVPFDDTRDHLQDALEEAVEMAGFLAAKIRPKSVKRKCKLWRNSLITYWEATKNRMKSRT